MKRLLAVVLLATAWPVAAQSVDPAIVGTWRLDWVGPEMFWQVRADGVYRLMGVGARPNEHWGRMQAANGKWSSEWERGTDAGSYRLNGNVWTVTATLGTGNWVRVWPNGQSSPAGCPYLDASVAERLFGSTVSFRMLGNSCEFSASKVGIADRMTISVQPTGPLPSRNGGPLADCKYGTNDDPSTHCLSDVGDFGMWRGGNVTAVKGANAVIVRLEMYMPVPILSESDSIAIARAALARL